LIACIVIVIILLIILAIFLSSPKNHRHNNKEKHRKSTTGVYADTTHFGNEILIELNGDILNKWIKNKNIGKTLYLCDHYFHGVRPNRSKIIKIDSKTFNQFQIISILHLEHNLLADLDENTFVMLTNLVTLRLDFNRLSSFNLKFAKGNKLEKLYLNNNQIFSIAFDAFSNLHRLKTLDLSFNKLEQFFYDITSLERYCLNNNEIKNFDIKAFENMIKKNENMLINYNANKFDDFFLKKSSDLKKSSNITCD
jgi:Leucine-rich repeat (LRR) protein